MSINKIHFYKLRFLALTFVLIIPFQNCTPMHSNQEDFDEGSSVTPEATQVDRFSKAMGVLKNQCIDCHSPSGVASFASFDSLSEQDFIERGLVVPGDVNSSPLILRSQFSGEVNGNMPTDGRSYSREDFMALYYWVSEMNTPDPTAVPPVAVVPPTEVVPPFPAAKPSISSFSIIHSQTNQMIQENIAGVTNINLSELSSDIKIAVNGAVDTSSTILTLRGDLTQNREDNKAPFELFPNGQRLQAGTYLIQATPYSETGLSGIQGPTISLTINVIDDTLPPPANSLDLAINGFNLINADSDTVYTSGVISSITLSLSDINFNMNIEAIHGADTGSMELRLSGATTHTQQENLAPFAIYPQASVTDYDGERFSPGTYVLTATAYENKNLMGQKGLSQSLTITIVDDTPPPPVNMFAAAQTVLGQHCVSCHTSGGSASAFPLDFANEQEFVVAGFVTPGDIDKSTLITRTIHYNGTGTGPQNMPRGTAAANRFTTNDYQTLVDWVEQMEVVTTPPSQQFACVNPESASETLNYTLTRNQYLASLESLFGASLLQELVPFTALIPSDSFDQYSHTRLNGLSKEAIDAYHNTALAVAYEITSNNTRLRQVFGSCATQSSPNNSCINNYLDNFAQRIFRRPLTNTERDYARALANGGGNYRENLNHLLAYHLQSPFFIMRIEMGSGNDNATSFQLTPYEVASRISFMTTDAGPDVELLNKAADGSIMNLSTMRSEARRLLNTPLGIRHVKNILSHWSGSNRTENLSSLPSTLVSQYLSAGLEQAMIDEADDFIEYIVYETDGSFQDLLQSKASFASHPDLAKIYQHAPSNPQRAPASATAVMGGRRQGLLLRAPQLTSPTPRTSHITRGVAFQAQVMCNELPSPPSSAFDMRFDEALSPDELLNATTRHETEVMTASTSCMSCHSSINPTGFALGSFGPFGELRNQEKIFDTNGRFHQNLPIDASANVPTWGGQSVTVQDAFDLVSHIATAPEGQACFARKMFRYLHEKRETALDNCQLDQMYQQVSQSNGSLLDAFVNMITADAIKFKKR
jgi:hypothetical protein